MTRTRFAELAGGITAMAAVLGGPTMAQTVQDLSELGSASHVVIPQVRGFNVQLGGNAIRIDQVEARVSLLGQTASTTIEIQLSNPSNGRAEAVLLLPVPDGAVVSSFMFEGAASEPTAKVLPRDEARRLYDSIVRRVKDPALLEFAGYNLIRTSVFPLEPNGTQRVRLTYENVLNADGNRVDYVLPRSESLERRVPWKISLDVRAEHPISMVYSPSHEIKTDRKDARHLRVSLTESAQTEPGSFFFSYLRERNGLSASLLAYPDPAVGGGYFLLMAGLPASIGEASLVKREVTLVIDRSGSMAGEKLDQVRAAARQVLEGLDDGEAFNIIDYATTVSSFAPGPVVKGEESIAAVRKYMATIRPTGGTNIHDALVEALRQEPMEGMLPIVLFLTDGLPTVGKTSEVVIRDMVERGNPHRRRVFTFGVGNDVNAPLLDRVAELSRATTTYVLPSEDVEVKVASVFKRLYGPVFADASLQVFDENGEVCTRIVQEIIPSELPDLFDGDQLILLGQYRNEEPATFVVEGSYLGAPKKFSFTFDFSSATTRNAFVPRLWASRRIAYLIDQIRLSGAEMASFPVVQGQTVFTDPKLQEIAEEILRLSTEFGILTEYTAFLATEGTDLSNWEALQFGCNAVLNDNVVLKRSGQEAITQSGNVVAQKSAAWRNYGNRYVDQNWQQVEINTVQQINDRTFFKRGNRWLDGRLIAKNDSLEPDVVIAWGSDEHLRLLHQLIAENRQGVMSLSGEIILQHEGRNILIQNDAQNDTQTQTTTQPESE